ncbi:hypothetical protein PCH_Pc20g13210 [Penicillium rubens Wisconsin 54-1255]|uniref:Uncharacterized protein n=1 Tax=Penicillium rubens (strain ATCC 28089 / DSM 1075 / NRRL 1951 / Wisconsin 54-1255) TaxID=500485 RepID=B6HGW1_PENRW|nr:hypothetical protein PCH_Pc20g13210 [Penicillium rubens Wisconsin 54-1255]
MEKVEDSPAEDPASPWDSSSSQYPLGDYCSVHFCNRTLLCSVPTVLTYFCATDSQPHEGMKESHRWPRQSVRLGAIEIVSYRNEVGQRRPDPRTIDPRSEEAKHRPYTFASLGKRLEFACPCHIICPRLHPVLFPLALSIGALSYTFV